MTAKHPCFKKGNRVDEKGQESRKKVVVGVLVGRDAR